MLSTLGIVRAWAQRTLDIPVGTYPPADADDDFGVVQRVGGSVSYPHDEASIALQVWAASEVEAEQAALALCRVLPTLRSESERINAVGVPDLMSLGRDENGRFVWQLTFDLYCNIQD